MYNNNSSNKIYNSFMKKFFCTDNITLIISFLSLFISTLILLISLLPKTTDIQICEKNILKVVEIKVSNDDESFGYGTGCLVSEDGLILTNKHMVYNSTLNKIYSIIKIRFATDNEFIDADVVEIDETADLAKIKIQKDHCSYFKLGQDVNNGETIYTIGNPNGFGLSFTKGIVSSKKRNVIYNDNVIEAMQTDFVINEGNSGGPIFNINGELVGIISFRLKDKSDQVIQGVSFGVLINQIKNFLNN